MSSPRGFLAFKQHDNHYCVYVPPSWDGKSPLPTILYLHGRGESGTDGLRQLLIGLPSAILDRCARWPFLVVAPQKPTEEAEWLDQRDWLNKMLAAVEKSWPVDRHRMYLTGLSQGGRGTMRLANQLTWQFAALAPVCGWADVDEALAKCKGKPLWAFHGEQDTVVLPRGSKDVVAALQAIGSPAELTLYPEATHNCWDHAYRESGLPEWLLKHTLG